MTALRHIPGHVVVFGTKSLQQDFDELSLSAFGELVGSNSYALRSGSYYLEQFVVNVGEELRFLDYARSQPGVIAGSLNYIGMGLSEPRNIDGLPVELSFPPGLPPTLDLHYLILDEAADSIDDLPFDDFIARLKARGPTFLVAAIDVTPEHCEQVIGLIAEGLRYGQESVPHGAAKPIATIIGLTSSLDNTAITDLYGFGGRILQLAQLLGAQLAKYEDINAQALAINLSVDFAQVIQGYNQLDKLSMESPDTIFTMPLFEKTLAQAVYDLTDTGRFEMRGGAGEMSGKVSPAVFGAAGNRLEEGASPRVRLGYPATRPEVTAASLITGTPPELQAAVPVDWVDVPATTALKPCFVIDVDQMKLTRTNGSSFACAWLAGHYARLAYDDGAVAGLGMLGKLAWLMRRTTRRTMSVSGPILPCFVAEVKVSDPETEPISEMAGLARSLTAEYGADFAIYGSAAALDYWLLLNGRDLRQLNPWVIKDIGDVDILYSGHVKDDDIDAVKETVRAWYKERLGRTWVADHKRRVDVHHYESMVGGADRLRSVTPVNRLFVTGHGILDTWGGLEDLRQRRIRFIPLNNPEAWARNCLLSSGADCPALHILHWISVITLLKLVSHALELDPPSAEPESVAQVSELLSHFESGGSELLLFGRTRADLRERVERRFERVETMMGSCARHKIVDESLDTILTRLQAARSDGLIGKKPPGGE